MASNTSNTVKALISLGLPPLALAVSFALAIAAALSPHWAKANLFPPTGDTFLVANRTHHRGVFFECIVLDASKTSDPLAAPTETCSRYKLGAGNCLAQYNATTGHINASPPDFNQHLCQQLEISGKLLVAAIVLVGIGMIMAVVVSAASWRAYTTELTSGSRARAPEHHVDTVEAEEEAAGKTHEGSRRHRSRHHAGHPSSAPTPSIASLVPSWLPYLTHPTRLVVLLATVALFLTELLAVNSLVNDASPNGDFMTGSSIFGTDQIDKTGSWYMDRAALALMPASWILAGFGVWVACWGWV